MVINLTIPSLVVNFFQVNTMSTESHTSSVPMRVLNILLAEDDDLLRDIAAYMLKNLGHSGVLVVNGKQALECLAQRRFDVVMLDVMMPVMDGLAALAAIRKQEQQTGGHQIVIMATSHSAPTDMARLLAAGADGYIAKPLLAATLQAELRRVMSFSGKRYPQKNTSL